MIVARTIPVMGRARARPAVGTLVDALMRPTSQPAGTQIDAAMMNGWTLGSVGGTWSSSDSDPRHIKVYVGDVTRLTPLVIGGVEYGSATRWMEHDLPLRISNGNTPGRWQCAAGNIIPSGLRSLAFTRVIYPNWAYDTVGGAYGNNDWCELGGPGSNFCIAQHQTQGETAHYFVCHTGAPGVGAKKVLYDATQVYIEAILIDEASESFSAILINNVTGEVAGAWRADGVPISDIDVLKAANDYLPVHGGKPRSTLWGLNWSNPVGAWPFVHGFVVPPITGVTAGVVSGAVSVEFMMKGTDVKIERSTDGGDYEELGTFTPSELGVGDVLGPCVFADDDVEVGTDYKYRLTQYINQFASVAVESPEVEFTEPEPGPGTVLEFSQGSNDDGGINFNTYTEHSGEFVLTAGFDLTRAEHRVYVPALPPAGTIKMEIWSKVASNPGAEIYESDTVDRTTIPLASYQWVSFPGFVGSLPPGAYFYKLRCSAFDSAHPNCIYVIRSNGSLLYRSSNGDTVYDNTGPMVGNLRLYSH